MSRKKICVQGLGFVGAAMAVAVASARSEQNQPLYDVVGVDLATREGRERVESLSRGEFPFATTDQDLIDSAFKAHQAGNLKAVTDESVYSKADVIIVDTPLNISYNEDLPSFDLTAYSEAVRSLARRAKKGCLILIESTVPPGTCDRILTPILEEELNARGLKSGAIQLAHSFERVMPGKEYLKSITNFWRVYAASSDAAADSCEAFLSSVIDVRSYPLTRLSSMTASETAKVMENSYRAATIAFMDEWTKFAEAAGIDLYEVTEAIRVRPTHSNIRYPGLGVGGYCLTKDPAFAPAAARQLFGINGLKFPFVELLSRVNRGMPLHAVERLRLLLGGSCAGKKVLLCGISYREDVGDTRFSPVEIFAKELIQQGADIQAFDPYVESWTEMDKEVLLQRPEASGFDVIVFTTAHTEFRQIDLLEWFAELRPMVLDTVNVVSNSHRRKCREAGIVIETVGRGAGL